jgi:stage V sporulation protein B
MISTAGLPVAMSRMIAQASSLNHYRQVRRIYTISRTIFLTLGLVGALLMTLFCKQLAQFQKQPDAWAAIGALGPCCFLICLMSTYRGFFQGQGNMLPTSVSQVVEAITKLVVGIAGALLVIFYTQNISLAAGAAIMGVTVSCLVSSAYLNAMFRKAYKQMPQSCEDVSSGKDIAKGLLSIAVPITIGSAGLQLLTVLETKIYMTQLLKTLTQDTADTQKGIYSMALTIFNMPCAFITPITISIIPAITAQLTTGNLNAAKATEESAARVSALISMPCAFGLALLAQPVTQLLGGYSGEKLMLATRLMSVLGVCIVFNATVLLTNAIMQAHGHEKLPVVNMFVGGFVKLIAVFILTGNPAIGIVGTPIGSLLCYLCITVLNLFTMRKVLSDPPAIVKHMLRAFLAAALMGACAWGTWKGLQVLLGTDMSALIACAVPIAVGVAVYAIAAVRFKAITREDCLLLPKGEKIANLLHL